MSECDLCACNRRYRYSQLMQKKNAPLANGVSRGSAHFFFYFRYIALDEKWWTEYSQNSSQTRESPSRFHVNIFHTPHPPPRNYRLRGKWRVRVRAAGDITKRAEGAGAPSVPLQWQVKLGKTGVPDAADKRKDKGNVARPTSAESFSGNCAICSVKEQREDRRRENGGKKSPREVPEWWKTVTGMAGKSNQTRALSTRRHNYRLLSGSKWKKKKKLSSNVYHFRFTRGPDTPGL